MISTSLDNKPNNWFKKSKKVWEDCGVDQSGNMFDIKTFRGKLQLKELRWIISHIPEETNKILDAGCGPGRYTQILTKRGLDIIGYDFSRNMLKKNIEVMFPIKPILVQGDIQTLPFKNNQFEVVFILDVLHHLTKEMRMIAIKEAFRVSNKYIFLDVKNKYNPYLWYRYKKMTDPFIRVTYTYTEIQNLIQKLGGNIIKKQGLGFPISFIAPYILIEAVKGK